MPNKIPMINLSREYELLKEEIDAAIRGCLQHQRWIMGPEVTAFEEEAGDYLGTARAIACSSGTDALILALRALAITRHGKEFFDKDDLILTTPMSFTATAEAIVQAGATPVFCDVDPETFLLDPEAAARFLKEDERAARAVGIVPVHLYGYPCAMDRFAGLAAKFGLFLVEDTAQAFGGSFGKEKLGTIGDAGAFSFFPSKNLGCYGDGGMVVARDEDVAAMIRILLRHGGESKTNASHIGYNARLDTLQAAILRVKLKHIDTFNHRRREIASVYNTALRGCSGLILPPGPEQNPGAVFHQYTARVTGHRRDTVRERLAQAGIKTMIYYPVLLSRMDAFQARSIITNLCEAETLHTEILSLPAPLELPNQPAWQTVVIQEMMKILS